MAAAAARCATFLVQALADFTFALLYLALSRVTSCCVRQQASAVASAPPAEAVLANMELPIGDVFVVESECVVCFEQAVDSCLRPWSVHQSDPPTA
jgi:hypothetical protein